MDTDRGHRRVLIGPDEVAAAYFDGSIVVVSGVDAETGETIRFGGDHRPMGLLFGRVDLEGDTIEAVVADWQIVSVR